MSLVFCSAVVSPRRSVSFPCRIIVPLHVTADKQNALQAGSRSTQAGINVELKEPAVC